MPQGQSYLIEGITIVAYLILMVTVGIAFNRFNKSTDDFFRSGCRGTWWLVGSSSFMISFSAWTFTGAAGAAFESGWTVLFIYGGNVFGYFICAAFIAPWLRQLRIVTTPEIYEMRYNEFTRQLIAYINFIASLLFSGLILYGLAIFCASVFKINIQLTIVLLGAVVIAYAMTGGSWAVLATDFLQGVILVPLTLLIAILCLIKAGGIGGFFDLIEAKSLTHEFRFAKPELSFNQQYSIGWACAIFINNTLQYLNFSNAVRYASVKTGADARKAALLAGGLTLLGTFIWMIPPITGRLLFADEILAMDIAKPAEAAYAFTALQLLPAGLTGILVVAIFSATMSNMDTGLNRNAAIAVRDIYPQVAKLFGKKPTEDQAKLVKASRYITFALGCTMVLMALRFSHQEGSGIFDIMLNIMAAAGSPVAPSALFGLIFMRVHKWSAVASIVAGWIPAAIGIFSADLFGEAWGFQLRFTTTFSTAAIVFLGSSFFWNKASSQYREKVKLFFKRRNTPVNFSEEVGESNDVQQLKILGGYAMLIAAGVALLAATAHGGEALTTLMFAGSLGAIGASMRYIGKRAPKG